MIDFSRIPDSLWQHVYPCPNTGCWLWGGYAADYGRISRRNPVYGETQAHRAVYACLRGPLSPPLVLDHLCMNKLCVNPWHTEEVERYENSVRGNKTKTEWGQAPVSKAAIDHAFRVLGGLIKPVPQAA